jgi:5-enolpyruvylshikimate-3-phosphate synthase
MHIIIWGGGLCYKLLHTFCVSMNAPTTQSVAACDHVQGAELFLGNAGTAMRPLTAAVAAAGRGRFVLDGVARMRERPIADLVDGLVQLGVDAKCTMGTGCPPVEVNAAGLPSGKVR